MRYHVLHIQTKFDEDWQHDLFDQHLASLGVDTIDSVGDPKEGVEANYYLPSHLWEANRQEIETFIRQTDGAIMTGVEACPDENWNATWEAEHPVQELPLGVRIIPHCAFGAGHHETTAMLIDMLLATDLTGKSVLDHGTGTGVLAIYAKRRGAAHVIAVDIDEKSVDNARENATLNGEDIEVLLCGTPPKGTYDLIMANIHRNILIENMTAYAACMQRESELWLSGFYEQDCPALVRAAENHGMHLIATHANGEWRMLQLRKS